MTLTAPVEKRTLTRGVLEVRRTLGGVTWNSEYLPLSVIPTMDWRYKDGGGEGLLQLRENRIYREQLSGCCGGISFETDLILEDDGPAVLKIACANPLKVWVNDEMKIDCGERTIVIPAYHRADKRKCCELPEGPGKHRIRIEIGETDSFEELYFMVVSPAFYWAYRIDSMFTV